MSAPVPLRLRPLEVGDVLDETFRIYRRHFFLFAGISLILAIPAAGLQGYGFFSLFSSLFKTVNPGQVFDFNTLLPTLVVLAAGYLITLLLSPFIYGAVIYAVCESAQGRVVTFWGAMGGVWQRYLPILGYVFLFDLMVLFFCLFPLWTWIAVGWIAVLPVMFVEDAGLGSAMGRSWRLVEGRWWRTFLILFLVILVWYFARVALEAFVGLADLLVGVVASSYLVLAISQGAGLLIAALVNPIIQIAVVLIYFDLRVRREALDLFQLAQHVSSTQPA